MAVIALLFNQYPRIFKNRHFRFIYYQSKPDIKICIYET